MRHLTFRKKLWLIIAVMWIALGLTGAVSILKYRQLMVDDRKATLNTVLDMARNMVDVSKARVTSGELNVADGKKAALAELSHMRYGENGYVYVATFEPVMLLNPARPKMVGKFVGDLKDAKGNLVYEPILKAARQGHGYVNTNTPKPGEKGEYPKLSAVIGIPEWDWAIGTGTYVDDIETAFRRELLLLGLQLLVAGGIASGIAYVIIRHLNGEIGAEPNVARQAVMAMADGDLSAALSVPPVDKGSVMFSIVQMQGRLVEVIGRLHSNVATFAQASSAISEGNANLSSRTEQQAAALEETAASMEQLTAAVKQNADNAGVASQAAAQAQGIVSEGTRSVAEIIETMRGITESAGKMREITGLIEGVSFQTNILALNAAVEAARAGEHGRGFAVVASEVRALAQRSDAAAKEIKSLIELSSTRISSGADTVTRAGSSMERIEQSIRHIAGIVSEIARASGEQRQGIEQISLAILQMDEGTQQNAALVEQVAALSKSLNVQTEQLEETISIFKLA